MSADNKSLGKFILDGIMPAPRGIPQVEVSFDIDANGILSVTAKDKATGKTQTIRIEGSTGISKDEVERMKRDADANAESDRKKQELITARNAADNLIYTAEKAMRDAGDKMSAQTKQGINEKIDALKKVKDGDNMEELKRGSDALSQTLSQAGAQMYQQSQPKTEDKPQEGKPGDGAQEGEFKEK
jgi:molecular chaperone DnaK